jgi:L-cysteine S-thiosulfotransferase
MRQSFAAASLLALLAAPVTTTAASASTPSTAHADGDSIEQPLTDQPGDAQRGRAIVANRQVGLCLLCHAGPIAEERFQGNLAPDLAGAGARLSEGQLRLRLVDSRRVNPASMMPAYYRAEGFARVGQGWQGKTVLAAQQVEDVVAYLRTLR